MRLTLESKLISIHVVAFRFYDVINDVTIYPEWRLRIKDKYYGDWNLAKQEKS